MAAPTFARYDKLVIEFEDPSTPGTWHKHVSAMMEATVSRSTETSEVEVPADTADESLPFQTLTSVKRINVGISGSGVWQYESHQYLVDWFYSGATRNIRVSWPDAPSGSVEIESGPARITQLDSAKTLDKDYVRATVAFAFDGTPTTTDAA